VRSLVPIVCAQPPELQLQAVCLLRDTGYEPSLRRPIL